VFGGRNERERRATSVMKCLQLTAITSALLVANAAVGWAIWAWPVLPFGSTVFMAPAFIWPIVPIIAVCGLPIALLALWRGSSRQRAIQAVLLCAAVSAGGIGGCTVGRRHRMSLIARAVDAASPLTNAIHSFERDHGRPPAQLSDLVPRYVRVIPSTGMGGYSAWEYIPDAASYEGNPWVLLIQTGGPGFNWDQLMYFPNRRYPASGYGGDIQRVGDWAYVHE
jgi:hypothetical protein